MHLLEKHKKMRKEITVKAIMCREMPKPMFSGNLLYQGEFMAQADIAEKNFIALNDVFADIFNVLVFGGKQMMKEEALSDSSPLSQYKADDELMHEQERDTFKLWRGHGVNLLLAGIENQTEPDKDMPFRVIGYDGAAYRSQLLKTEEKEINGEVKRVPVKERYPVLTIVLYFGEKLWNYPRSLKDCFYPPLEGDEITNDLEEYIQDYRIHVFDIPRLTKEQVQMFQSDFKIVADYFTKVYTKNEYVPDDAVITHVDEFLKLMKVLTGDKRYEEIAHTITEKEKEGIKVCRILDEREARGEARMGKLIQILLSQNLIEEAKKVTEDKEERERFYILYNI